jgi:hypothetical protein
MKLVFDERVEVVSRQSGMVAHGDSHKQRVNDAARLHVNATSGLQADSRPTPLTIRFVPGICSAMRQRDY